LRPEAGLLRLEGGLLRPKARLLRLEGGLPDGRRGLNPRPAETLGLNRSQEKHPTKRNPHGKQQAEAEPAADEWFHGFSPWRGGRIFQGLTIPRRPEGFNNQPDFFGTVYKKDLTP
jgi:hypothetical protein